MLSLCYIHFRARQYTHFRFPKSLSRWNARPRAPRFCGLPQDYTPREAAICRPFFQPLRDRGGGGKAFLSSATTKLSVAAAVVGTEDSYYAFF